MKRYFLEFNGVKAKAIVYQLDGTFISLAGFEDKLVAEERLKGYELGDEHQAIREDLTPVGQDGYDLSVAD